MVLFLALLDTQEEQEKFREIYENYRHFMWYIAQQKLKDTHLAEDAVQEAFLALTRHLDKVEDAHSPRTKKFLATIVRSKAIDLIRKNNPQEELTDELPEGKAGRDILDQLLVKENYNRLISCVLELDDSYRKKNKKKLGLFAATVALAVVSGITAGIGYSGMQRIKLNNYNQYIENGMNYCREENYEAGTAEFKKAIELDGSEEKAYEQYIQAYIDATNKAEEAGTESTLNLDDALTLVSNRISSKHGGVEKNSAVLYKLALTYFEEERSYSQAAKYFGMIDEKDEEYGKLAGFYKSISELRSDSTSDASELMQAVNDFATYNENNFTNQEATKFVNYRIIGEIYSTNVSKDAETSIAEQASTVMEQAVADLDEYTGNDLDEEAVMDMNYRYDDNLIMIYEQLAKENADNETVANGYYSMAISYCEDYIGILKMKVDSDPSISLGGSSVNAYNQSYYNKMMTEARCYDAQGKTDDALKIYEAAEKVFGTKNEWSDNVYAEHLDYLYRLCEAQEQDPKLWTTKIPDLTKKLIQVFDDGGNVLGIDSNKTWYKRKDTLQMLKDGSYDISEEETTQAPDANSDDSQSAEMGE